MNRPTTPLFLAVAVLLAVVPLAAAQDQGNVRVESIEAEAGSTSGRLVGLLIDHDAPDLPVADSTFSLDGSDVVVTANHVEAKVRTTSTPTTPQTIYGGGPASIVGVESRPDLHFWITPLDDQTTIEVQHRACTAYQPPVNPDETRRPALNGASNPLTVATVDSAQVASCTEAVAVIQGDLAITAWEWDMTINGDRVNSGVNDTARNTGLPATGAGSADELHITAHDATLTIPLTAATYELYITHPRLQARELRLTNAQGTLPGILEPLQGVNVELAGDYALTLDATTNPFAATVTGTTTSAATDAGPLTIQIPTTPPGGSLPRFAVFIAAAVLVLGVVAVARYGRPLTLYRYHSDMDADGKRKGILGRLSAGVCVMAESDLVRLRLRRARRRARRAMRLDSGNAYASFVLGGILLALNDPPEAQLAYRHSQERAHSTRLRCYALVGEAEVLATAGYPGQADEKLLEARRIDAKRAAEAVQGSFWDEYPHQGVLNLVRSTTTPSSQPDYFA